MEFTKTEVAAVEQVEIKDVVTELDNLELSADWRWHGRHRSQLTDTSNTIKGADMEFAKIEIAAVEHVVVELENSVKELGELELAMIGGGMGDIILAR